MLLIDNKGFFMLPTIDALPAAHVLFGALAPTEPDCACPMPPHPASQPRPPGEHYQRVRDLHSAPLRDGWTLWCNTLAGGAPVVLNAPALARLTAFERPSPPATATDLLLAEAQLIAPPNTHYSAPTGRSATLTAWMHVTNACNLDCPYCYIRKSSARMSLETGMRAIDALVASAKRHGFDELKLKYAGGEAALHYRVVQQLHCYATQQAAIHGLTLRAVVLSNGTVMPHPFAEWLAATGVRLMVSVDGVGADHDQQRPHKDGSGSFAAIERTLRERLLPRGIRPDICITITGRTAGVAAGAVAWALDYDLPFSLNFYRENEQSAGYRDLRFQETQIIAGIQAAYALIERRSPERPLLDGLLDRVQAQAHGHTCGVGQSYVVVTHDGKVAQCQMELQQAQPLEPHSDVIALVASGPLHNVSVDEKEGCRECLWRYRCAGGCPIVTLRATGRTDVRSPNCAIYQTLLPAALRLEGLRILQAYTAHRA